MHGGVGELLLDRRVLVEQRAGGRERVGHRGGSPGGEGAAAWFSHEAVAVGPGRWTRPGHTTTPVPDGPLGTAVHRRQDG
ncbi:hypothetical protein Cpa01nite_30850 [Cellulomonas pakistanensis]|uniref:Uncharacterized protein n=1 Tax=Cellulomonas pakistanensis TaxID=992287 RepID=A0A919U758_9CELL|nr:hypothetical protein Cpa01nite_30850 [Cellulomonas pakistanensis]